MSKENEDLKRQLKWYNNFADCVKGDHRIYDVACEYADELEGEEEESEPTKFKEGDDYFSIEVSPEGEVIVSMSCWDEISEEMNSPMVFATLREALNEVHDNEMADKVIFHDFTSAHSVELMI